MKIDKKNAVRIITEAAVKYQEHLNHRQFLILFRYGEEIRYAEVGFRDMNFLHLTGVKCDISAQRFFERCINRKLSERDISIDGNGKIAQKLHVLPYIHELLYHNCMIGDFVNSGVMIQADYFVGDTKLILSVGFRHGNSIDIPVTLYSGDVRKLTKPTNKVLAIYRRTYPKKKYKETTYISNGFSLEKAKLPVEVIDMLEISDESSETELDNTEGKC